MSRGERHRYALVVLLTLGTGIIDAVCFLHLGGAFASVMTGNMVMLGLSAAGSPAVDIVSVAVAVATYIVGVVLGTRLSGAGTASDRTWPTRVTLTLTVETLLLLAFAGLWYGFGQGDFPEGAQAAMLAAAAAALGVQSAAVGRFGVPGLSSTYLTGTLTKIVGSLTARRPLAEQVPSVCILLALIAGAGLGYLIGASGGALVPVAVCAPVLVTVVSALVIRWEDEAAAG